MEGIVNKKYFNAFNLVGGIGPIAFKKLIAHFESLENAWLSSLTELGRAGLNRSIIEKIRKQRPRINPDLEMEKLSKENIDLITVFDKNYPRLLKEIYAPPAMLYIRGQFKPKDKFSLGVVGPRKLSSYGKQITPLITTELSQSGLTIVSGLAKGIDTLAHQATIKSKGRTIAVLGSGLDKRSIYPYQNQRLAEEISQNGALISEYPIGYPSFCSELSSAQQNYFWPKFRRFSY